ncbi:MAG: hypothetical protein V8Q30_01550 [Acutalibacteraceae bacterium]
MLRHDLRRTRLMSALFFLLEFIALPLQLALLLFSGRPEAGICPAYGRLCTDLRQPLGCAVPHGDYAVGSCHRHAAHEL